MHGLDWIGCNIRIDVMFLHSIYAALLPPPPIHPQDGLYPWSIVSDPLRFFLFVLVRDPEAFFGSQDETDVLALCKDLGFTSFWNTPKKTVHEGCVYPSIKREEEAMTQRVPKLNLRRKLGLGAPLHASCKVS